MSASSFPPTDAASRWPASTLPPGVRGAQRRTRWWERLAGAWDAVRRGPRAERVARLQRRAETDAPTGVLRRDAFVRRLAQRLAAGAPAALLLVRAIDLQAARGQLGVRACSRQLAMAGELLQAYRARVPGAWAGRLNSGDFALLLPARGVAGECAQALHAALAALPAASSEALRFAVGGVELPAAATAGTALAAADAALAQAEHRGRPVVRPARGVAGTEGAGHWPARIAQALAGGELVWHEPPGCDAGGPRHRHVRLRLSLDPCEPPGDAWRALALRSGATAAADLAALDHALAAQQRDGVQRVVELAPASLRERGFAEAVTLRLVVHPVRAVAHAPVLAWRSTPDGADPLAEAWQSACAAWLAAGARLAARHAGGPLVALDTWRDAGVTAVVVDGALLARVALDDAARAHAFGMAALLRDAGLEAWADGVRDERDRAVLPSLGFRRVAGP